MNIIKNKIIYSQKVMEQLVERGHIPIATLPNPKDQKYICWIFAATPEFLKDVNEILGGKDK